MATVKIPTVSVSREWMGKEEEMTLGVDRRHVIFTVGVSASGKTTWAKQFGEEFDYMIISRDDLRAYLCNPFSWTAWKKRGSKGEKAVNALQANNIEVAIDCGSNVIICDTNLTPRNWKHIAEQFSNAGYSVWFKFFDVDWKTAVERDNARANGVGYSVLAQQFEKIHAFQYRQERSVLNHTENVNKAVLCDIDGTLAHMATRGPYDYDQVLTDSLDQEVFDILQGLYRSGYEIIIVSGRDGICKKDTYNWLRDKLGVINFRHYQRATGDTRPDDVIKEELLDQIIEDGFNPKMVFDDRPRVARRWRALGLKVFQVGNPYIEF